MIYISKHSQALRAYDRAMKSAEVSKVKPQPIAPVYRDMQNVVDKMKRGEKL